MLHGPPARSVPLLPERSHGPSAGRPAGRARSTPRAGRGYTRPSAAVAQLARASACHAEGRGFESLQPLSAKALLIAGFSAFWGLPEPRTQGSGYHFWVPLRGLVARGGRLIVSAELGSANRCLIAARLRQVRLEVLLVEPHGSANAQVGQAPGRCRRSTSRRPPRRAATARRWVDRHGTADRLREAPGATTPHGRRSRRCSSYVTGDSSSAEISLATRRYSPRPMTSSGLSSPSAGTGLRIQIPT